MTQQTRKLFISYRQADNRDFVRLIHRYLSERFGHENVFIDVASLPKFEDIAQCIRDRIIDSDAVMVIIGPKWLKLLNNRIDSGELDYVRLEIETALQHDRFIAPICIMGAKSPSPQSLPESLRKLSGILAASLKNDDLLDTAMNNLMDELERRMIAGRGPLPQTTAADTPSIAPEAPAAESSSDSSVSSQQPIEQLSPESQPSAPLLQESDLRNL
ncbi:MAG: toll/interleukin-1 receptor domain-containing protein [Anaerolineae bacterium]